MNILAFQSSGDQTSVSIMLDDEINSFNYKHNRKDRPNWNMFLENIGLNNAFALEDVDLFAFSNCQNSYTATRSIASYLKGVAVACKKPLIVIEDDNSVFLKSSDIVKLAKDKFDKNNQDVAKFDPNFANPIYKTDTTYKKINE